MSATASVLTRPNVTQDERISWTRFALTAPLTLIVAIGACLGLKSLLLAIDPSLSRMPQLGPALVTLTIEGSLAAIVVFAALALILKTRAFLWFRIVGAVALVLSWLPDVALALGGTPMMLALRFVGPLASVGMGGAPQGGPPPGAQAGGPPPGFLSSMPAERVLVLMALHTVVAVVCVGMLTTLPRVRVSRPSPSA